MVERRGAGRPVGAHDPQIAAPRVDLERRDVVEAGRRLAHQVHDEVHALVHDDELAAGGVAEYETAGRAIVRERDRRDGQGGHP